MRAQFDRRPLLLTKPNWPKRRSQKPKKEKESFPYLCYPGYTTYAFVKKIKPLLSGILALLDFFCISETPNNVYFHHLTLRKASLNPPTYKGEGKVATSLWGFWSFFLDDQTSASDVFCSCLFIPILGVVMVNYYGYDYRDFSLISNSWKNSRWRAYVVTSQASSSANTHKLYLILLRRSKAFHWRQNRFEILQHIKRVYHGGGMKLRVRLRVNSTLASFLFSLLC